MSLYFYRRCLEYLIINVQDMDNIREDIQIKPKKKLSVMEQAKEFLDKQIHKKEFVIDDKKIPNRRVREFLQASDFLYSPCKYMYIIKDNTIPDNQVLEQNYFNIVSRLAQWNIVTGELALNHHIWKTAKVDEVDIVTQSKNGEVKLGNNETYVVRYQKSEKWRDVEKAEINGAKVYIETPTSYLINNFSDEAVKNEDFNVLLNSTNFMLNDIETFVQKWASIRGLSQMALWYKENDNMRNYTLIKTALQKNGKWIDYGKTHNTDEDTKALNALFSSTIDYGDINEPTPDKSPKIVRFEKFIDKLDTQCSEYLDSLDLWDVRTQDLDKLLENIEHNVAHDSYHSLTIENYNVSIEDINILNDPINHEKESEEIQNKLTIKWYLRSYKMVVDQIKLDYWNGAHINKNFITTINNNLFQDIADSKNYELQNEYRKHNIEITGTTHLPPNFNLVEEYMDVFLEYINDIEVKTKEDKIRKAVMTHFLFVYIHPFGDGNGRTARFLMNHTLWSDKLDWVTVLSDRKKEYIDGLKKASEKEDITDFTKVITRYLA